MAREKLIKYAELVYGVGAWPDPIVSQAVNIYVRPKDKLKWSHPIYESRWQINLIEEFAELNMGEWHPTSDAIYHKCGDEQLKLMIMATVLEDLGIQPRRPLPE